MKNIHSDDVYTNTRNCILKSAKKRLLRYGYTKTTLSETASDISMSTANLYRFFNSKEDIFLSCINLTIEERFIKLHVIVSSTSETASKKLELYALALIRERVANLVKKTISLGTWLDLIAKKTRRKFGKKRKTLSIIEKIIVDETANKEFFQFHLETPLLPSTLPSLASKIHWCLTFTAAPEMELQARGIIRLIINGLHCR
jgi:AcrR family transcriptional regulator